MRYAYVIAGLVVAVSADLPEEPPNPGAGYAIVPVGSAEVVPGQSWDGSDWGAAPPIEPPSPSEIKAALAAAVQAHVQATARARGYDGAESCASYALSGNPVWAAEAGAFMAWRDAVWASALATLAAVEAGAEAVPTVDALIAGLPVIAWPE